MKRCFLSLLLISCCGAGFLQGQPINTIGLQWSSSKVSHNVLFEDFNMGSELSVYGFIRWRKYIAVVPEIGLRQQNHRLTIDPGQQIRRKIRFGHVKINVIFPFKKSFYDTRSGWFASAGFSQNLLIDFHQETWENNEMISRRVFFSSLSERDLHVGVGYSKPISDKLNFLLRGEYGVGLIGGRYWRRDEFSLSIGLGLQLDRS